MSSQILWPLLLLAVVLVGGFYWLKRQLDLWARSQREEYEKQKEESQRLVNLVVELQNGLRGSLDKNLTGVQTQLQKSQEVLGQRLDNAARVVAEVSRNLGSLGEATKKVVDVGKDISSLQEILRSPKLRGGLGELFLGDLLAQIFPPSHFELQHRFKSGEAVDAVIKLGKNMVPVDAKFPLENFKRLVGETGAEEEKVANRRRFLADVKRHIESIAGKYILPDEGTFDFALMYIPAENVYYELIIKDEAVDSEKSLLNYAFEKRVIPVSPNSFYAYLQTILLGLKGMHIEAQAQEILGHLSRLSGDFRKFHEDFELLGKHLTNVKTKYDDADKRLMKFGDRLQTLSVAGSTPHLLTEAAPAEKPPLE